MKTRSGEAEPASPEHYLYNMKLITTICILLAAVAGAFAQDDIRVGYCGEIESGYGEAGASVTPWITLTPDKIGAYAGCRITKVRIGLRSKAGNVYVYLRRDREDKVNLYSQKVGKLESGWQTVELETPYEIQPGEQLAIGYKGSFTKAGGAGYTNGKVEEACHVFSNVTSGWSDVNGAFCIQAVVEGAAVPANEVGVLSLSDGILPFDADATPLTAHIENLGSEPVETIGYELSIDDAEPVTGGTIVSHIGVNETSDVEILVPSVGIGRHKVRFTVKEVNGVADSFEGNNSAEATVVERDPSFRRVVVAEEVTGTWCSWCPRGIVGLEMMAEKYPDQFIGIAVHSGDVMSVDSYSPLRNVITALPGCMVNRHLSGDPYEEIENMVMRELNQECHVGYSLETEISGSTVTATSTVKADVLVSASSLGFSYVVVEDRVGMDGNPAYFQKNSYSGSDIEMGGWQNLPSTVENYRFNDVARGIYPYEGTPLLTEDLQEGGEAVVSRVIELPDNIMNMNNVSIVGLVIDLSNGFILNAAKTALYKGSSSLEEVPAEVVSEEYYTIDGTRISRPVGIEGLYIRLIRMSDGSIRTEKCLGMP